MIKRAYIQTSLGLCLVYFASAKADHPTIAFGGEGIGAINTISATSLAVGSWAFGMRSEIISNEEFSAEQLEYFAANGLEGVHSLDSIINSSFSLSYGATENLSINVRLPYIQRENISESELEDGAPEAHTHGDSAGLGDLVVLGQYRRMQTDANFGVSLLFGLKAPTGETETKDDDSVRFETEFQPGNGSWDFLLGASASKSSGNVGYHANVLYTMTTEGAQSTEIGDAIAYNAALTYRLNDFHFMHDHTHHAASNTNQLKWDLSLELNGDTRRKNSVAGVSDEHSGGTAIYASPGFKVSYKSFSGFISFGIPVTDDSNGTQTDVDSRIVTGLSVVL